MPGLFQTALDFFSAKLGYAIQLVTGYKTVVTMKVMEKLFLIYNTEVAVMEHIAKIEFSSPESDILFKESIGILGKALEFSYSWSIEKGRV